MEIKTVGVLGCGLMGSGIAQVSAAAGYRTIVREVDETFLNKGLGRIKRFLDEGVEKGKVTADASDTTYQTVFAYAESLGKEPITAPDRPGFIVNRLLVPYLLDAIRAYENGLGTLEDIDKGMKLGCGYPMGPFTLLDFVGLDTTYYIANIMFEEFREPAYAPPPLLKRMVLAGRMGRKSGRGFYSYEK